MIAERIYPCRINGKIYSDEVDIEGNLKQQVDNILKALEDKYNDEMNLVYNNKEFKKYIKSIEEGKIRTILNPSNSMFKTIFDDIVLEYGSYEFVERMLSNSSDKVYDEYFKSLDDRVRIIQNSIMEYCKNIDQQNFQIDVKKLLKKYINFIENFAPQRLAYYTTYPVDFEILNGMKIIKELSLKVPLSISGSELGLSDIITDFDISYSRDSIQEILDWYQECNFENDLDKKQEILNKIDDCIAKNGVNFYGNNKALINLSHVTSQQTFCAIIDSIVERVSLYGDQVDISEDFEQLLEKITMLKNEYSLKYLCTDNIVIQKFLQILNLNILPEKENKILINFLDNELGRKDIEEIDMSSFDSKIDNKERFSEEEVKEFYDSLMMLTFKNGEMPVKYNEFLLARIIEGNKVFTNVINYNRYINIIENFAIIKSKQLVNNGTYITFSTNRLEKNEVGNHIPKFIRIRPVEVEDKTMSIVFNIITIFHELKHEQQQSRLEFENYDYLTYMILKENFLKIKDYGFYKINYETMYEEVDAEHFALSRTLNFLETLPLNKKFSSSWKWNGILNYITDKLDKTEKAFQRAKNKRQSDGKLVNVEDEFEQLIFEHPELIQEYDILKIEYLDDGIIKSPKQIFEEMIESMKTKEGRLDKYNLYKYILLSRSGRCLDECMPLEEVKIPEDLDGSVKISLSKLRDMVLQKNLEKYSVYFDLFKE